MNNIPAVNGVPYVNNAEFVKLTISLAAGGTEVFTFSSSYKEETINGSVYKPLGGLIAVSTQQRDLRATSYDTTVTLAGVDQTNIYYVLSSDFLIKGSTIQVYRGFYDSNYNLTSNALRYTGIVTSWAVQENVEIESHDDNYTVSINCSNYKTVLENRIAGRNTNPTSWRSFDPTDSSMDNVPNLVNANFDFGKKVTNSGTDTSSPVVTPEPSTTNNEGGYGP